MGKSIHNFNIPVCHKFRSTFLDGQLCYQLDANELRNKVDKKKMASEGVIMLLDYNFERTVTNKEEKTLIKENSPISNKNKKNTVDAMIYIETLGNYNF